MSKDQQQEESHDNLEGMSSQSVLDSLFRDHYNLSDDEAGAEGLPSSKGEDFEEGPANNSGEGVVNEGGNDTKEGSEETANRNSREEAAKRLLAASEGKGGDEEGSDGGGETGDGGDDGDDTNRDKSGDDTGVVDPDMENSSQKVKVKSKSKSKSKSDGDDDGGQYAIPRATTPQGTPRSLQDSSQGSQKDEDLSFLTPEQQDEYELLRFGEQKFPDRFRGRAKELLDYYKKHQEFVDERSSQLEEEGEVFDSHDPEYQKWLRKNQPKFSYQDRRDLREEMLTDKILKRVDPRLREHEEQLRLQKLRPVHDKLINETLSEFEEQAKQEYDSEDAFETEIFESVKNTTSTRVKEYLRLIETPDVFDPHNPVHVSLDDFITRQGRSFYEKGGKARIQNGKRFLPVADFLQLSPEQAQQYWTFSEADIVRMLKRQGQVGLQVSVKKHRERMEKSGYVRKPKDDSPKPKDKKEEAPPKKKEIRAPRVTSSVSSSGKGSSSRPSAAKDLMEILYPSSG